MSEHKIYSLIELEDLSKSLLVVVIDGGIYDVTEFVNLHPGGREVLIKFNRRDATQAFHAVHHSAEAIKILPKYCLGILEGCEEKFHRSLSTSATQDSFVSNVKKKLITHEDKFHIHKILGTLVVSHFLVRILILFIGTAVFLLNGNRDIFLLNISLDPAWLLITMALVHGLLSLSGLQFFIPKKSNQSKPMMHRLFRAHSIAFALRAVACMLVYVLLQDDIAIRNLVLSLIIFITLIIADIITKQLTDPEDRFDTTASMPYWFGVSPLRQKVHKFLYGYAQFLATIVCLTGGYAGALYTLAPIQGAAFGLTLNRKNLISAYAHHNIYLLLLFLPIPFAIFLFPIKVMGTLVLTLVMFYLRTQGVSKYVLWLPVLLMCNILLIPQEYWKEFFIALVLFSFIASVINLIVIKVNNERRIDKNNRLMDRKIIAKDAFEVVIRSKLPMRILPGQHVLIRLNDQLERKYTPIWSKYLAESDQTLLCLRIKKYARDGEQTASGYLASCPISTVLDLHGPLGEKYFCHETKTIVDQLNGRNFKLQENNIYLLAAGSGITPIFQFANILCRENIKVTLLTCDKAPDFLMMSNEIHDLKVAFPHFFHWICIFSDYQGDYNQADLVINKRLNPEVLCRVLDDKRTKNTALPDLLMICGPDHWQKMISKTLEEQVERNVKCIIW